jgi:hypothetical protein
MAFTPSSTVYLLGTPLDNKYKNQILFPDGASQYNYFINRIKHRFEGVTYQRKDNYIRVNANIDDLWDSNYVMYNNYNFTNKYFYAFITKMEYVSDRVTDVFIETDVFQTWLFECNLKESFVVREHVSDDTIGANLLDEQLEIGEYKMATYDPVGQLGVIWNVLAVSDTQPMGSTDQVGNKYGNVVTGLTYYPFPNTTQGIDWLKETIAGYASAGKPDAIVMIFTAPKLLLSIVDSVDWFLGYPIPSGEPYGFKMFTLPKNLFTVDGYTPKNNKLHTYPYKFFYASNNSGQSATFRYEDFSDPSEMDFSLFGTLMPNPMIMLAPSDFKGDGLKYEYGLTLTGFPLGSWTSDAYTAWFAQNGASTGVALAGSAVALVGGAVTGNIPAVIGGAMGVFSQMAQIQKAQIQPDQAKGQVGAGSLHFGDNSLDFFVARMTIKAQYAKMVDDYFTMFGYKVNRLKVPETHSRAYWNYIQTIDVNINGQIPDDDMLKLKSMYDNGVTLWHDPDNFLNYDLNNTII